MGQGDSTSVQGAAAFGKAMAVLQAVADAPDPVSVAEIARATGLPRPTAHRIVAALAAEGMVFETPRGGAFGLGPRLMALAGRAWDRFELRHLAAAELAGLRDATGETVHLAVRSGAEMIVVDKLESPQAVRMASRIGTRMPLHSSSVGKAWMAALAPAEAAALLPRLDLVAMTPHTLTTLPALQAEIDRIRARGYATDAEENETDIWCYGAAIAAPGGGAIGCVSVSIPKYRAATDDPDRYTGPLLACCRRIAALVADGVR
ncbi:MULTISPECIES: IclR family transcriptional regulator [Inquilinus]|uniref:DNA-binding IclR family transcriptional regulator n=1 Tax=Inquilinus ginsengisoli TaxID=363840 RepID=A0ABU1JJ42_9PROT|nr:IclR family transcriptional regulator [Inquilinus ginsengisoli]MDR6288636.1 DNA-binding IclR family transcriptional regulator [Inquilinus ginsengisoli]